MTEFHRVLALNVLVFFTLLILCGVSYWFFRIVFHSSYFDWYSDAGPVLGLVAVIAAVVFKELDEDPYLISANPLLYLSAYFILAGSFSIAVSAATGSHISRFDRLMRWLFLPVFLITILGWLILVVPAQYFVFLISGAFPRVALKSPYVAVQKVSTDGTVETNVVRHREVSTDSTVEKTWVGSLAEAPFSVASAFSVPLLYFVGKASELLF